MIYVWDVIGRGCVIEDLYAPASDEHECRGEEQRPSPRELDEVDVEQVVRARHVVRRLGREVADHAQHERADDVDADLHTDRNQMYQQYLNGINKSIRRYAIRMFGQAALHV